jgi:hypothetical protein
MQGRFVRFRVFETYAFFLIEILIIVHRVDKVDHLAEVGPALAMGTSLGGEPRQDLPLARAPDFHGDSVGLVERANSLIRTGQPGSNGTGQP